MGRNTCISLNVTQDIIDSATPEDTAHCVIAQALKSKKGIKKVKVTAETVSFVRDGKRFLYRLPAKEVIELVKFDTRGRKAMRPHRVVLQNAVITPVVVQKRKYTKTGKYATESRKRAARKFKYAARKRFRGLRVIEVPVGTMDA